MQDLPNTTELIQAVIEFLTSVTPKSGYQNRIAANMLHIVQRELSLAPSMNQQEFARLQALLNTDKGDLKQLNQSLCTALQTGAMHLSTPALADHLWQTSLDKLTIDQPKYSTYQKVIN